MKTATHHDPVVRLAFEPVMQAQVRSDAAPEDAAAAYSIEDHFGVSGWSLDKESSWKAEAKSADSYLAMERLVRNGNLWYPDPELEWPSDQYTLSCIGFAPFEAATACTPSEGVVFDEVDTSSDPGDLHYTEPQTDLAKSHNGGIIPLPMIPHSAKSTSGYAASRGTNPHASMSAALRLAGIALKGRFQSLPEPKWTPRESGR